MSKNPIQEVDDLFKTTGMKFGLIAKKMSDDLPGIFEEAKDVAFKAIA